MELGLACRFFVKAVHVPTWGNSKLGLSNEEHPAFAIRYKGTVYAYLNRCAHIPMEMDWSQGRFFDLERKYLICATHDANYLPDTGVCISGPCPKGSGLVALNILEREGQVYLVT